MRVVRNGDARRLLTPMPSSRRCFGDSSKAFRKNMQAHQQSVKKCHSWSQRDSPVNDDFTTTTTYAFDGGHRLSLIRHPIQIVGLIPTIVISS